jgi:hypothetical protein
MTAFDDKWAEFEASAGPFITDEVIEQTPVGDPFFDEDSGMLADSMEWDDRDGTLFIQSRDPRGPIAAYVARGTRPHDIYPVNAPYLHFFAQDGAEVRSLHVRHPGTVANPFNITAWENVREQVQQMFRDTVGGGVTLSYLNPWRNQTLGED